MLEIIFSLQASQIPCHSHSRYVYWC